MAETKEIEITKDKETDDEIEFGPFLDYLKTEKGHEIASRILNIIEDVKKATIEKSSSHAVFEKWLQAGIIVIVVLSTSFLSYLGKFETSLGVLFGTLVGYIFGRK